MIELGTIPVDSPSSVFDVRRKIARLAEALRLDAVTSTWLATVTSEVVRRLSRDQHEPRISIGLIVDRPYAGLVLVFEQRGNVPETDRLLHDFDDVRTVHADDGYHGLWACRRFLTRDLDLSEAFIREQRARIQQPSRTELMHRLQATNGALERHRDHLEATVAERTTALAQQTLEATLLHRTMQIANEAHTFEEALQRVLVLVCELAKWPVGHIYELAADEADKLVPTTLWHLEDPEHYAVFREVTERTPFVRGEGLPGRVLASGKPAWIVNVQVDTNFPRNKLAADLGVKGAFGFPVHVGNAIVAVLEFFADEEVSPDESLLDIVHSVGVQLGKVLERKRSEEALRKAHEQMHQKNEELQRTLQELQATQAQLVQAEKMASLGQLTAGIAHEIKNPLNFVNNFAEITSELVDELADELEANKDKSVAEIARDFNEILSDLKLNAEKINEHGKRADGIVCSMMQHASGGSGEREPTNVNALVEEYVNLAYHGMRASRPGFTVEIERAYDAAVDRVEMAPQEMGRVLLNLLSNAFDAGRAKTDGTPTVKVSTRLLDGQVEIRVEDNGPGIPRKIREKIFEPFFTTKPAGSGTGLGLSLSYDIVTQRHGGTLTVETEEGEGATFVITLPHEATPTDGVNPSP